MGDENFREILNLKNENSNKIKNKLVQRILKLIFALKINDFAVKILVVLKWYYPIVLILKKNK